MMLVSIGDSRHGQMKRMAEKRTCTTILPKANVGLTRYFL
jgi:hypothetical protein